MVNLYRAIQLLFKRRSRKLNSENRVLAVVTLSGAIICFLTIIINSFSDFYSLLSLIMVFLGLVFLGFSYLSFFKGVYKPLNILFQVLVMIGLTLNWFFYQGLEGATPFFFFLAVFVIIYSNHSNKKGLILISFLVLAALLVGVQYIFPEWIIPYDSKSSQLTDLSIGFLVSLFSLGYLTIYLKKKLIRAYVKNEIRKREQEVSEARFRDIAMSSGDWIWEIDEKGVYTFCSEKVKEILGYSSEEIVGTRFLDYIIGNENTKTPQTYQQIIENGAPFKNLEFWHKNRDGKPVCLRTSGVPIFDSSRKLIGYRGVDTDITIIKEQEESIYWKQYFLDALMNNIPDAIYFKDMESRFMSINKSMAVLFGLDDPGLAKGKTDFDFFKTEHSQQAFEDEQEIIRTGIPVIGKEEMETWFDRPSTWVSSTKMPLSDDNGKIIGTFGISRDITERKRMQDVIEKRIIALTRPMTQDDPIRFDELFNLDDIQHFQDEFSSATGVASVITRPDGTPLTNPSNFTRFCSDVVRQTEKGCANCFKSDAVLGAPHPGGPIVQHCLSGGLWDAGACIIVGDHHIANWLIGQVREESQSDEAIRKYAKEIGVEEKTLVDAFHEVPAMSKAQFDNVAKSLYTLANQLSTSAYQNVQQARFIFERKKAEEALKANEALLQDLNATKDRFFSIIAHDLKTPFNSILGFSELMKEQIEDQNLDKVKEFADIIRQSALKTMDLLNNLLDWSRTQTGKMDFTPEKFDLTALVHETADLFINLAAQKSIRLILELPERASMKADKPMIYTVLRNLLSNAIKFTNPGGCINLHVQEEAKQWLISVSDNGVGMLPENLKKLFRIDETYSTNGTRDEQGTGLGLILCKEFVVKHGGTIWAESEPDKGSTFRFTIPKQ
jgi:PAS domain S-box-containing protein